MIEKYYKKDMRISNYLILQKNNTEKIMPKNTEKQPN